MHAGKHNLIKATTYALQWKWHDPATTNSPGSFFVFVHFFVVVFFLLVLISDVILDLDCQTY